MLCISILGSSRSVLRNSVFLRESDSLQARIQYHTRELLKCLAHASLQSGDGGGDIDEPGNADNERDSGSDNDIEEEEADGTNEENEDDDDDDLRCPLQVCEQMEEFETLKELSRHFATRIATHYVSIKADD
jgi:hypothetical protein